MAHEYSLKNSADTKQKQMTTPKTSTVNFIRQFARTYVKVKGCTLGAMVLN